MSNPIDREHRIALWVRLLSENFSVNDLYNAYRMARIDDEIPEVIVEDGDMPGMISFTVKYPTIEKIDTKIYTSMENSNGEP